MYAGSAVMEVRDIGQIADLTVSPLDIVVDEEYFIGDMANDERVGSGAANLAAADDGDSRYGFGCFRRHCFPICSISSSRSVLHFRRRNMFLFNGTFQASEHEQIV